MLVPLAPSTWLPALAAAVPPEAAAKAPPLLRRFAEWFDQSPVPASLVALALAVVAVALLRMALKFFLVFLLILMILILGSYLFMGEEETGEVIKDNVYEITDPPAEGEGEEGTEPQGEPPAGEQAPGPVSEPSGATGNGQSGG